MVPAGPSAHALIACADDVPLLGALGDTLRRRRGRSPEAEASCVQPDRPRLSFLRHPAKSGAIRKTGVPFTVAEKDSEIAP
jgi:hypothetical protein